MAPNVVFTCPNTGKTVPTGISMDEQTLATATLSGNFVYCPHCRQTHVWSKEQARVER